MDLLHSLTPVVYLILVATVCVSLFKYLGLGGVMGLLVTGIIVGPFTPGPVATEDVAGMRDLTELGVVLLLFIIGLEMEPQRLWGMRREVFGFGSLQVTITGLLLGTYIHFMFLVTWHIALLIGFTIALSSTALVLQMLEERGEIASRHGRTSFAVLLFQDLAVIPLLAVIPILSGSSTAPYGGGWQQIALIVAMVVGVIGIGRYVIPFVLEFAARHRNMDAFALITMLSVLGAAWAMEQAGLPMEMGAFLMGMMLSRTDFHHQLIAQVQPFKGLMMGLFFISVGMSMDIGLLLKDYPTVLESVLVIMVVKATVLLGLGMAFGMSRSDSVRVAFGMPQCGEFGFVIFALAGQQNLLSEQALLTGFVVIAVSMLLTPLSVKLGELLAARLEGTTNRRRVFLTGGRSDAGGHGMSGHVLVAGYGRIGQTVCALLQGSHIPYIAFDSDRGKVDLGRRVGHNVTFGDLQNPAFLASVGLGRARLAVMAVDNELVTDRGVSHIRQFFPHVTLVVRVRDLRVAADVLAMGASVAFPDSVEASLQFSREVLHQAGIPADEAENLVEHVRRNDYELIRTISEGRPAPTPPQVVD